MRRRDLRGLTASLCFGVVGLVAGSAAAQNGHVEPRQDPAAEQAIENPHGQAAPSGEAIPGIFQPPEDTESEDPTAPPGGITVDIRDADDKPLEGQTVVLGILINSIAQGDTRKHEQAVTDASGRVTFRGLETASNIAYRVSAGYEGGAYAALPFQLAHGKAMRVVLHVFPVTHDVRQARIVSESAVAVEVKDDRLQLEEAVHVYNVGRVSWSPTDVRLDLPDGATAFSAQTTMSDQGADQDGHAVKLRGTFAPGQHTVDFRFQLPWSGARDVSFDVGMPPHVAVARVLMPAAKDVTLEATGFPRADVRRDPQGQSYLVTDRRMRADEGPLTRVHVAVHGLPSPGPGRIVATLLAALGVAFGIVTAASGRPRKGSAATQARANQAVLEQLWQLEQAKEAGDVGPKTYEKARRDLIDALAEQMLASRARAMPLVATAPVGPKVGRVKGAPARKQA